MRLKSILPRLSNSKIASDFLESKGMAGNHAIWTREVRKPESKNDKTGRT